MQGNAIRSGNEGEHPRPLSSRGENGCLQDGGCFFAKRVGLRKTNYTIIITDPRLRSMDIIAINLPHRKQQIGGRLGGKKGRSAGPVLSLRSLFFLNIFSIFPYNIYWPTTWHISGANRCSRRNHGEILDHCILHYGNFLPDNNPLPNRHIIFDDNFFPNPGSVPNVYF